MFIASSGGQLVMKDGEYVDWKLIKSLSPEKDAQLEQNWKLTFLISISLSSKKDWHIGVIFIIICDCDMELNWISTLFYIYYSNLR